MKKEKHYGWMVTILSILVGGLVGAMEGIGFGCITFVITWIGFAIGLDLSDFKEEVLKKLDEIKNKPLP